MTAPARGLPHTRHTKNQSTSSTHKLDQDVGAVNQLLTLYETPLRSRRRPGNRSSIHSALVARNRNEAVYKVESGRNERISYRKLLLAQKTENTAPTRPSLNLQRAMSPRKPVAMAALLTCEGWTNAIFRGKLAPLTIFINQSRIAIAVAEMLYPER